MTSLYCQKQVGGAIHINDEFRDLIESETQPKLSETLCQVEEEEEIEEEEV